MSFPAGGVKLNHAKRDTLSGFQLLGIQDLIRRFLWAQRKRQKVPKGSLRENACEIWASMPSAEMCNLKGELLLRNEKEFRLRHRYRIEWELACRGFVHSHRFRGLRKILKKEI